MKIGLIATVLSALVVIVGVSLGAHIYRWEGILWPVLTIVWCFIAALWERMATK